MRKSLVKLIYSDLQKVIGVHLKAISIFAVCIGGIISK